MRLIFLGPPGVGKGTQADFISHKYKIPKLSTGDLLRESVLKETALGKEAKEYMKRGELVPDAIVIGLVDEKLSSSECQNGFLLDGFPRTVGQADQLSNNLASLGKNLDCVIYFSLSKPEIIRRISGRRSCPQCKAVYHLESIPPKKSGICDVCGIALVQRNDDMPETIEARLAVYQEQTAPLINYYKERHILGELDGAGLVSEVQARLVALLPPTRVE
ncbi:MAG: adenylate kinase [Nitrospirota bacterium]|nr:adenylate kinase [Nitrospirota bacterium]